MKDKSRPVPSENVTPCWHMETLLHRESDGKLRGFARWYALAHAARCPGCAAFLRRLEAVALALRAAKAASVNEDALDRLRQQVSDLARTSDQP